MLSAGDPLVVEFRAGGCHSRACTGVEPAGCSVTQRGNELEAMGSVCMGTIGPQQCNDDCGVFGVQCGSERLAEGDYTVRFGDLTVAFSVPGWLGPEGRCVTREPLP